MCVTKEVKSKVSISFSFAFTPHNFYIAQVSHFKVIPLSRKSVIRHTLNGLALGPLLTDWPSRIVCYIKVQIENFFRENNVIYEQSSAKRNLICDFRMPTSHAIPEKPWRVLIFKKVSWNFMKNHQKSWYLTKMNTSIVSMYSEKWKTKTNTLFCTILAFSTFY